MTTTIVVEVPADDWFLLVAGASIVLLDIYAPGMPDTATVAVRVAAEKPDVEERDGLILDEHRTSFPMSELEAEDSVWARSLAAPIRMAVLHK